jgi:hypothetical protein
LEETVGGLIGGVLLITVIVGIPFVFWPFETAIIYTVLVALALPVSKLMRNKQAKRMINMQPFLDRGELWPVKFYPYFFLSPFRAARVALMFNFIKYSAIPLAAGLLLARKWILLPSPVVVWVCAALTTVDFDPLGAIAKYAEKNEGEPGYEEEADAMTKALTKLVEIFGPKDERRKR